jgi:hypothetical protein
MLCNSGEAARGCSAHDEGCDGSTGTKNKSRNFISFIFREKFCTKK